MSRNNHNGYDAVYVHARREAIVLLIAFTVFLLWSVGVSYWLGYEQTPQERLETVLGIPRWVFWGVAVPWMAANAFTFWFCLFHMKDDPLGEAANDDRASTAEEDRS